MTIELDAPDGDSPCMKLLLLRFWSRRVGATRGRVPRVSVSKACRADFEARSPLFDS